MMDGLSGATRFKLPVIADAAHYWVEVLFTGDVFAIEEPLTGWWISIHAWSRSRFEASVGHLDVTACGSLWIGRFARAALRLWTLSRPRDATDGGSDKKPRPPITGTPGRNSDCRGP